MSLKTDKKALRGQIHLRSFKMYVLQLNFQNVRSWP